jgi:hypothetical protein
VDTRQRVLAAPNPASRRACPACAGEILPGRWRWRALMLVTGRCPWVMIVEGLVVVGTIAALVLVRQQSRRLA